MVPRDRAVHSRHLNRWLTSDNLSPLHTSILSPAVTLHLASSHIYRLRASRVLTGEPSDPRTKTVRKAAAPPMRLGTVVTLQSSYHGGKWRSVQPPWMGPLGCQMPNFIEAQSWNRPLLSRVTRNQCTEQGVTFRSLQDTRLTEEGILVSASLISRH